MKRPRIEKDRTAARQCYRIEPKSIFIGGGTPTCLPEELLEQRNMYINSLHRLSRSLRGKNRTQKPFRLLQLHFSPLAFSKLSPEGGLSEEEVLQLREAGAVTVSLGKRILRTWSGWFLQE